MLTMRKIVTIIFVIILSFAQPVAVVMADDDIDKCKKYKPYPSHYQRCQVMQERIERMNKFKEKRKQRQIDRRASNFGDKTKQQIEKTKEDAKKNKQKIENAIKKKAEDIKKMEEEQKAKEAEDALPEEDSAEYTPIVVDPTQLTKEQLTRIQAIINGKDSENSENTKNTRPQKPTTPSTPNKVAVPLPNVGTGKKEYIEVEPVTPNILYGK